MFRKKKEAKQPKNDKKVMEQLSPAVQKAEELRQAAHKAELKAGRINKQSKEEFYQATTEEEKKAVRKKWTEKRKTSKFESDKAFALYKDYLQKTFGIDNLYEESGEKFAGTDKRAIKLLQKKEAEKAKKAEQKSKSEPRKKRTAITQADLNESAQNFIKVKDLLKSGEARNLAFRKPMKFFREHSVEEAIKILKEETKSRQ